MSASPFDALILVSFGGPEGPAEVGPFLDNVLRGRAVPPARRREVEQAYARFGGVSPINARCRDLLAALRTELAAHGVELPLYWGNRNWTPLLADELRRMRAAGVRRALALVTSAYGSYSGCRQYLEDIARARAEVGPDAPAVAKLRLFHDHPGFVAANAAHLRHALEELPAAARPGARVVFTAHSLPVSMAASSPYEAQLRETCGLVAHAVGLGGFEIAYQSRSGPPSQPWLGPDVEDRLRELAHSGVRDVVLVPVGFVSDHMEVVYDLDVRAAGLAAELGLRMARARTAGTHPAFVAMMRELIQERLSPGTPRAALGSAGAWPDDCPPGCCVVAGGPRA